MSPSRNNRLRVTRCTAAKMPNDLAKTYASDLLVRGVGVDCQDNVGKTMRKEVDEKRCSILGP